MENTPVYEMATETFISAHLLNEMTHLFQSDEEVDLLRNAAHRQMLFSAILEDTVKCAEWEHTRNQRLREAKLRFVQCPDIPNKLQLCLDEMDRVFMLYKETMTHEFPPREMVDQWRQNMMVSMKFNGELRSLMGSLITSRIAI